MMSLIEFVTHEVKQLDEKGLEQLAHYLSSLKRPGVRPARPPITITPEMEALYAQFADEDVAMAESGMADYVEALGREEK